MSTNEITTGPAVHGIPPSDPHRVAVQVPEMSVDAFIAKYLPAPVVPVLATAPGQTWREAIAGRLASEPAGLRPVVAKPAKARKPKGKAPGAKARAGRK
jgi:hypothetical protein